MEGFNAIYEFKAAKGFPGMLETLAYLRALEESGEGYYGEWAALPKELRAEYYLFMSAGRALFAPVGK